MKTFPIMANNNLHITAMITTALLLLGLSGCATFLRERWVHRL